MPWPHTPVPADLAGRAFHVSEGVAAGLTLDALRHPRFAAPFPGVRTVRTSANANSDSALFPARAAQALALQFVPRLRPGEAFSHTTALALLGCPIRAAPDVHTIVPRPASRSKVRGVIGHTYSGEFTHWIDRSTGARTVPPLLAFTLAAALLSVRELVVAADHLLRPNIRARAGPLATHEELIAEAQRARTPGVLRARAALEFARSGSESRMETLLRLVLIAYGIDVFELQIDVHDPSGRWIGRFDMGDLERKILVEYDGEQHRTNDEQYERDAERLAAAHDAGFVVLRFRRRDVLYRPRATAGRIADALGVPLRPPDGVFQALLAAR
ncbi:endonuclease domain-containing protein [Leucobacter luti]|uniref:endonuclease domain-containing protein n=1 Tax=Leucobacter luti TaxID=340320 RepID=UPI001C694221|nr:DUF559 domain-containing protein [Leucobacter luti]QYM75550.1 DUF559 domain-containing protein [Leucobacter luti]